MSVAPAPVGPRVTLQRKPTLNWRSWTKGIRSAATNTTRTRYTTAKATRYFEYAATTSVWRHVAVVALMPLPGVLVSLLAPCIPLQPPSAGVLQNPGFCLHIFVTIALTMVGAMLQTRAGTGISHSLYTNLDVVVVAAIGSLHVVGTLTLIGYVWRFPVPFSWVLCFPPWLLFLVWSNFLVLRSRLVKSNRLRNRLLFYIPSMAVQLCQIVIYPVYSAAFEASGQWGQYALVALFPVMKWVLRRVIFAVSHHLTEFVDEISVSGVEICASMYQSMIMQNTPSKLATALVMVLDVCQGLFELKLFVDHDSLVPNAQILTTAMRVLKTKPRTDTGSLLKRFATKALGLGPTVRNLTAMIVPPPPPEPMNRKSRSRAIVAGSFGLETDNLVLTQALELLQAADSILLVEYLEVAVPIANAMYLYVASHLKSAIYNPKIQAFYLQPDALYVAVGSVLLYALLQTGSLIIMCVVMGVRYHLSALTLLAFMMEEHAWSLQGKMFAWLPSILAFSVFHYGIDFTFKFDYSVDPVT